MPRLDEMSQLMSDAEQFFAYRGLCRQVNTFFTQYISAYCQQCQQVLRRLPEGVCQHELVSGVFPGCCHRGAGDIFRLEGVRGEDRLSPGIIALLRKARNDKMKKMDGFDPVYELKNHETGERMTGEHCCYFGPSGCSLGELKGPLCINFICPPIRDDLLLVTGNDEELVGPEHDFLGIYQLLSVLNTAVKKDWTRALHLFGRRLARVAEACEKFIAVSGGHSLFSCFCVIE